MSEQPEYFGHFSVKKGVITIDLGGRLLEDGVYSIVREFARKTNKLSAIQLSEFADSVRCIKKAFPDITRNGCAVKMGVSPNTFIHRIKRLKLQSLFK